MPWVAGEWTLLRAVCGKPVDEILATGTEQEVKATARTLARRQGSFNRRAMFLTDIYIERPDGKHQDTTRDDSAEDYEWVDVTW
jgi:hypothetical protein